MRNFKRSNSYLVFKLLLIAVAICSLTSCAAQIIPTTYSGDVPGLLMGIWHGLIAPFALIGHIFAPEVRIYAFPNSGGWYDFGFLFGLFWFLILWTVFES